MRTVSLAVALSLTSSASQAPAPPPSSSSRTLILSDVSLINPAETGRIRQHIDIVVRDKTIVAVRPHGSSPAEPDAERIDGTGTFALPGFVDMHVHALLSPRDPGDGRVLPRPSDATTRELLALLLKYGVTTIRDPGDPTGAIVALREAIAAGRIPGPTIYAAGAILNASQPGPEFVRVTTEDEVCDEIARQSKAGVDMIKVYSGLRPPLVAAALRCAHERGLPVVGHLQATTWTEAAELGIDAIAHGAPWAPAYLSEQDRPKYDGSLFGRIQWLHHLDLKSPAVAGMAQLVARRHVSIDPTLIAYHTKWWGDDPRYTAATAIAETPAEYRAGWARGSFTADWTREMYAAAKKEWPKQQGLLKLLYASRVVLTVGTDTPTPWIVPGLSLHQEMLLMRDAGMRPIDVLKAATANAAIALGKAGTFGRIGAGARADIVVLDRNPLADLRDTRAIRMVIKDGRVVERR